MVGLQPCSYNSLLQLFLCVLCWVLTYSSLSSAHDDAAALLKVKEQLGNPVELSEWISGTDYCSWRYIFCSSARRVRSIFLQSVNVSAPMPSTFGDLTALETLDIEKMPGLYGPIPSSLSNLSLLQIFNIIDTSITGPIPDSLSCTNITSMALFMNRINGTIPESLSRLPYLNLLDLSYNSLTGCIPSGLVQGMPTVQAWLILHHNNLTGEIPRYYGARYFNTINIRHNRLTGNPSFLFARTQQFTNINLSWNNFKFVLMNVKLPDTLLFLDLCHNSIKGRVPTSLINVRMAVLN